MSSALGRPLVPALVSVVVPARNAAGTIAEQVRALMAQEVPVPWELVVVDNGSIDGTAAEASRAFTPGRDARVEVAIASSGAAYARNEGVRRAAGDLLVFCDADDRVAPGWLAALVAVAAGADAVTGAVDLTALNPGWVADGHDGLWATRVDGVVRPPLFGVAANGNNLAVWRHAFEVMGGFDESYRGGSEDKDLGYRLQAAGFRVVACREAVVAMRLRSRWRDRVRQQYRRGHEDVRLYQRFAADGYPPRGAGAGVRTAAGLVRDVTRWGDRSARTAWWNRAARTAGRVRGSLRHRVLYV